MADEAVIRIVVEDGGGAGGGGTQGGGGGGGSIQSLAQQARQLLQLQTAIARGQAQAAAQPALVMARIQAQIAAAQARGQAQMMAAAARGQAQAAAANARAAAQGWAARQLARAQARGANARASMAEARANAQPDLLGAQIDTAKARLAQAQAAAETARLRQQQAAASLMDQQKSGFDLLFGLLDQFRGTLGGFFGKVAGSVLDVISAYRSSARFGSAQATKEQIAQATRPLNPGEAIPGAPPGMQWAREPVAPNEPASGIGPTRPFQPGKLVPKKVYSRLPVAGLAPVSPQGNQPGISGTLGRPGVIAGGQPGTPLGSGVSAAGAAGGAAAAIGLMVTATKAVRDSLNAAADAGGKFTASMISASESPTEFMNSAGTTIRSFGDSLGFVGSYLSNFGAAVQAATAVMREIDQLGQRYGQYSGQIATAQALADVRQTIGDLRRSQEAAPALVEYINAQSRLQQKIEDTKIRILQKIMPAVVGAMEFFETKALPILEGAADFIADIAERVVIIANRLGAGIEFQQRGEERGNDIVDLLEELARPGFAELPTNIVRGNSFEVFQRNTREGAG